MGGRWCFSLFVAVAILGFIRSQTIDNATELPATTRVSSTEDITENDNFTTTTTTMVATSQPETTTLEAKNEPELTSTVADTITAGTTEGQTTVPNTDPPELTTKIVETDVFSTVLPEETTTVVSTNQESEVTINPDVFVSTVLPSQPDLTTDNVTSAEATTDLINNPSTIGENADTTQELSTTKMEDVTDNPAVEVNSEASDETSGRQEKQLKFNDNDLAGSINPKACPCPGGLPGSIILSEKEPSSCPSGRVVVNPDCPCTKVCARQSTQKCGINAPCDEEFGLKCQTETKSCQGKLQVQTAEVTHESVTLQWRSSSKFPEIPQAAVYYSQHFSGSDTKWSEGEVKESTARVYKLLPLVEYFFKVEENGVFEIMAVRTKDGCLVNGTTFNSSVGLGETFHADGCERTCTCREGGQSECRERCPFRPGYLQDPLCTEVPDPEDNCCVLYKCSDHQPQANAKVLVTQRTPSSLTLAWDDFKLPNYESGYVVEYRGLKDPSSKWEQVQAGNIPLMTVTKLTPHTAYQVRVMVWEDIEAKKRGTSSEVVTIFTEDGCVRNNQTLAIGSEFSEGCDLSCVCKGNDEGECRARCSPPYYRAGYSDKDPLCSETPLDSDPCCVTIRCQDNLGPRESLTYSEKRGSCPETIHLSSDVEGTCPKECSQDNECTEGSVFKCCPNYCGGTTCTDVSPPKNVCENVFCGSNSHCAMDGELPKCVCLPGYNGDPNSLEGCHILLSSERVAKESVCVYGNSTYSRGAIFEVGCELRCNCGDDLEVACTPRCAFHTKADQKNSSFSFDPLCDIIDDPVDSCCAIMVCENNSELSSTISPNNDTSAFSPDELPSTTISNTSSDSTQLSNDQEESTTSTEEVGAAASTESVVMELADNTSTESTDETNESTTGVMDFSRSGLDSSSEETSTVLEDSKLTTVDVRTLNETSEGVMVTMPSEGKSTKEDGIIDNTSTTTGSESPLSSPDSTTIDFVPDSTVENDEESYKNESSNDLGERPIDRQVKKEDEEPKNELTTDESIVKIPVRLDGCEYNNGTYRSGEKFEDGCEARCTCDSPGRVSCVPRCALAVGSADESVCRELVDPNDSCCKILVCERPGDRDAVKSVDGLKLIIDSAEPQNATTVRLRLTVGAMDSEDQPSSSAGNAIQVWYAPSKHGDDSGDTAWKKENYKLGDMQRISPSVFEVDVKNLEPETEYFFKVKKYGKSEVGSGPNNGFTTGQPPKNTEKSIYSNTVNVKTYSKAIQSVFKGCFHRNATYEVGQVFTDGCQYKCVCHQKGLIQCQDRCEQYIDTAGYEHCQWGPAPDDPCCTIPFCNGEMNTPTRPDQGRKPVVDPQNVFCVNDNGDRRPLGDTWELGEGCTRKVCTCAMRSNGTTVVECSGGCSPIPASVQHPTPDCPQPVLVTPDDPCLCPYILCNNAVNPLSVPTPMCEFKSHRFHVGEEFHDGCRAVCHCGRDLRVNCAQIECPHLFPAHLSECLEWDIDPKFVAQPPNCCPPAKCKNDGSCQFKGMQLSNFQPVPQDLLDCGTRCVCVNGNVTCEQRCPQLAQSPPPNLHCPPSLAYKGNIPGDSCCQHWICRSPNEHEDESTIQKMPPTSGRQGLTNGASVGERECEYNGKSYLAGEQWEVRKGSLRRLCTCRTVGRRGQRSEVDCSGGCPAIPDRFRLPSAQCLHPVLVTPDDPVMCPYVVCNNSLTGKGLENVSFVALNSTSVRLRFTIPSLLVGLAGHAELRFTTDPSVERDEWHVQKFARPQRLFDTNNIEYHLSGLRPGTTYFFQIALVIDALHSGPESEIYKLRLPITDVVSTTTEMDSAAEFTTVTSTTLPPMILVDAMMSTQILDPSSVKVSWRSFEPNEKRFIDGLRLKYRVAPPGGDNAHHPLELLKEGDWKTTTMIHRDVTNYVIRDLEPSASYQMDMEFSTPDEIATHLVSTKTIEMKMPAPAKKEEFNIVVKPTSVSAFSTDLTVQGIPEPHEKYINVVKVTFKSDADAEETQVFKSLKADGKVPLDQLKPGRRYKVWADFYLTNGKTMSSNVIEVMTKAAPPGAKSLEEPTANMAEALQGRSSEDDESKSYYIALIVVAVIAAMAALGFVVLLVILLRRQSSAKAPITRSPSEAAYDNPTYKTYEPSERHDHEKNGNGVQPC